MDKIKCKTCVASISNDPHFSGRQKCVTCSVNSETKIVRLEAECKSAAQRVMKLEADVKDQEDWRQKSEKAWKAEMTWRQQLEGQGRQLLQSGVWSDVVIRVDGQDIPAHKCILGAK